MDQFNLNDAIYWADVAAKQRFQGLSNTKELKDTVTEMFNGASNIMVEHVQGTNKEFKCRLLSDAKTREEVCSILASFERNTYITTKTSKNL